MVIGLMKDEYARQHDDLALQVSAVINEERCPQSWDEAAKLGDRSAILRVDDRTRKQLLRTADHLCVRPISVPQLGGAEFLLTVADIASRDGSGSAGRALRSSSMVKVEFVKVLPGSARVALTLGTAFLAISGLAGVCWFIATWRIHRARRIRPPASFPGLRTPTIPVEADRE